MSFDFYNPWLRDHIIANIESSSQILSLRTMGIHVVKTLTIGVRVRTRIMPSLLAIIVQLTQIVETRVIDANRKDAMLQKKEVTGSLKLVKAPRRGFF